MKRALFALSLVLASCGGGAGGAGTAAGVNPAVDFAGQAYTFTLSSPPSSGGGAAATPAQSASGTIRLPAGNAPGNVTITPSLPSPWPTSLAALPAGDFPIVVLSVVADSTMMLGGTPVVNGSFTVAQGGSVAGGTPPPNTYFLAEYTSAGWKTVDVATIAGAVVSIAGTSVPVSLVKGVPTYFVLYAGAAIP